MKNEVSAGGLIVRKLGKIWEILLIKDMNGNWTFPKGLIEKEEDAEAAARREIAEEVGITGLKLMQKLNDIEYWYRRNGLIHKLVRYFLFEVKGNPLIKTQKEEGISEAKWFRIDKTTKIIGYPMTNVRLLEKAKSLLTEKTDCR